ncbi:MAG TPA: hypothetical protein VE093_44800 [Polyangiaceae bacterium]|nr:hypothetical protein [Polyangiaceae bacterium]
MNPRLRTMRVLWAFLLASTGIYAAVLALELIPPQPQTAKTSQLLVPFAALALGLAVMSFVIPKVNYKQLVAKSDVRIVEEPIPEVFAAGYRQAAPERRVFADPEAAWREAAKCFQPSLILGIALSEAAALLGFVLGFLGFPVTVWAPFMIGGAALIAVRFPTKERVVAPFEAALGARFPEQGSQRY